MISACSGAAGSPRGAGTRRTSSSSSSGTFSPVLALTRNASCASMPMISSISLMTFGGSADGRSILLSTGTTSSPEYLPALAYPPARGDAGHHRTLAGERAEPDDLRRAAAAGHRIHRASVIRLRPQDPPADSALGAATDGGVAMPHRAGTQDDRRQIVEDGLQGRLTDV